MADEIKQEEKKSINPLLDEAKAQAERLEKLRDEAKAQADRLEQLRSEQLLSGTAGIRVEVPAPRKLTPKEYVAQLSKGIVPKDTV